MRRARTTEIPHENVIQRTANHRSGLRSVVYRARTVVAGRCQIGVGSRGTPAERRTGGRVAEAVALGPESQIDAAKPTRSYF